MASPLAAQNRILVSKPEMMLFVITSSGDTVFSAPIACGKNYGNKQKRGDMRTPEGEFYVQRIHDSTSWTHDFHDGYGERKHAYGPYFIRLKTPFAGIGIHGTCFPESIGTRCSEGCIRLKNNDLVELKRLVKVGTKCTIMPDR